MTDSSMVEEPAPQYPCDPVIPYQVATLGRQVLPPVSEATYTLPSRLRRLRNTHDDERISSTGESNVEGSCQDVGSEMVSSTDSVTNIQDEGVRDLESNSTFCHDDHPLELNAPEVDPAPHTSSVYRNDLYEDDSENQREPPTRTKSSGNSSFTTSVTPSCGVSGQSAANSINDSDPVMSESSSRRHDDTRSVSPSSPPPRMVVGPRPSSGAHINGSATNFQLDDDDDDRRQQFV